LHFIGEHSQYTVTLRMLAKIYSFKVRISEDFYSIIEFSFN